jgi:hypothetical protein
MMRSRLARLGDAMLAHVLPAEEAAALCISGAGDKCKCGSPCGVNYCTQYVIDCQGSCVKKTGTHC